MRISKIMKMICMYTVIIFWVAFISFLTYSYLARYELSYNGYILREASLDDTILNSLKDIIDPHSFELARDRDMITVYDIEDTNLQIFTGESIIFVGDRHSVSGDGIIVFRGAPYHFHIFGDRRSASVLLYRPDGSTFTFKNFFKARNILRIDPTRYMRPRQAIVSVGPESADSAVSLQIETLLGSAIMLARINSIPSISKVELIVSLIILIIGVANIFMVKVLIKVKKENIIQVAYMLQGIALVGLVSFYLLFNLY